MHEGKKMIRKGEINKTTIIIIEYFLTDAQKKSKYHYEHRRPELYYQPTQLNWYLQSTTKQQEWAKIINLELKRMKIMQCFLPLSKMELEEKTLRE